MKAYSECHRGKERSLEWDCQRKKRQGPGTAAMEAELHFCSSRLDWEEAWDLVAHYSTWLIL